MTLNGAIVSGGVATPAIPRRITIYSDGADTGITFTVTGRGLEGKEISEVITGPGSTTVTSTKTFKTVTSVEASGNFTGHIEVGTADDLDTAIIPLDTHSGQVDVGYVLSGGVISVATKVTMDNVYAPNYDRYNGYWETCLGTRTYVSGSNTGSIFSTVSIPCTAIHFTLSSFVSGASAAITVIQREV